MSKKATERSGVARCQRCFKYGHMTFECQSEPAYRYRPSRTMQYKQKLQMQIKASKPPKSTTLNPDYKRRVVEDGPSSDSEQDQKQKPTVPAPKKQQNLQNAGKGQKAVEPGQVEQSQDSDSSSSSDSSQSSDSDSSSSQEAPRKKKPS